MNFFNRRDMPVAGQCTKFKMTSKSVMILLVAFHVTTNPLNAQFNKKPVVRAVNYKRPYDASKKESVSEQEKSVIIQSDEAEPFRTITGAWRYNPSYPQLVISVKTKRGFQMNPLMNRGNYKASAAK